MFTHYVVTNREITTKPKNEKKYRAVNEEEFIRKDGKELSSENLRFGKYTFEDENDDGNLTIYKEKDIDNLNVENDNVKAAARQK